MLQRKKASQKIEKDWFQFAAPLSLIVHSDYIALRLLYYLEPLTTAWPVLTKMIDVAEKSLKLYLTAQNKSVVALSDARSNYGHHIEKLRIESTNHNSAFGDEDIKEFSKDLNDKSGALYQYLRYGSQETTNGSNANLGQLMLVIDKIFFKSILLLPPDQKRVLTFVSPLKNLVTASKFDQSQNPTLLLKALKENNAYLDEYLDYCKLLDKEHLELTELLKQNSQA
jgi:hypothetical protein